MRTSTFFEKTTLAILWGVTMLVFAALYGPAFLIVTLSFFDVRQRGIDWGSFSFDHYSQLGANEEIMAALGNTLLVGISAVTAALVLGLALAYYMRSAVRRGQAYVEFVLSLPFVLPAIVTGISLLMAFNELGIERGLFTIAVGHTVIVVAIIYRMAMMRLHSISLTQIEASLDLGASSIQTFWRVILPQLGSVIVTSALLSFTLSLDETLVTFFLVGGDTTLPLRLWAMMRVGFSPEVNALVSCVLLFTVALATGGAILLQRTTRAGAHG